MSRRVSDATSRRRSSIPDLMRRHSSLLASLTGDAEREGRRSERRQSTSDLEKEFPNLRASPRRSTCQSIMEEEPQSLSLEELEQLLENCTKLTRDNQLTEGRLWGLALPQHMPDLVRQNTDQAAFNFQKVSFGLDAAVQIYSKRVDSMHNAALDTRSRLTNQRKHKETDPAEEKRATTASTTTARRRARRPSEFGGDSTLATNLEAISVKGDAEDSIPVDPLFHKTSALFDAGGFKGLPTLNLGMRKGGRFFLDMTEIPHPSMHHTCRLPHQHKLKPDVFGIQFELLYDIRQIAPSYVRLNLLLERPDQNHSIRELIRRGMNAVALSPQNAYPENGEQISHQEIPQNGMFVENGFEVNVDPPTIEDAMDECEPQMEEFVDLPDNAECDVPFEDAMEHDGREEVGGFEMSGPSGEGDDPSAFAFDMEMPTEDDTQLNLLDEETISWLLDAKLDKGMSKGRAWTGASHWKYPQAATRSRFERDSVARQRRREPKASVDFVHLPDVDLSKFKKPEKESAITVLFKEDVNFLLPTDYRYNASFLLQLPLRPSVKPREWLWTCCSSNIHHAYANGDTLPIDNDSLHMGMEDWGQDVHEENDDFEFDVIQGPPPQIEEDVFHIEAVPKRVNMQHLKAQLWSKIEARGREQQEIPFEDIIPDLTESSDVSFGVCFACSLHLAVEHGFHIVNHSNGKVCIILDDSMRP